MKSRTFGTVVRGIRTPIITHGDDLAQIVADSLKQFSESENAPLNDGDIVGITEAVVARAQGNYVTVDDVAADLRAKFGGGDGRDRAGEIGVVFPILSRNRFAVCLRGIAKAAEKIYLMLSYPSDEVGNALFDDALLDDSGVNLYTDTLSEADFARLFGKSVHPFTGVDYVAYYKQIIEESGAEACVIFANNAKAILDYTGNVLCCDIHTRFRTKERLKKAGAKIIFGLDDICASPSGEWGGYNAQYGLLGSNKSTEEKLKLFPRDCGAVVADVAAKLKAESGRNIEVLIYGDGAFKDPQGKIWELADPVVSPAHTPGLDGVPNELKLKYITDNNFADLKGEELEKAVIGYIRDNAEASGKPDISDMEKQGTTPRRITDLLGSLCDLTSGSGDKGTPVVLIQGYFDKISD